MLKKLNEIPAAKTIGLTGLNLHVLIDENVLLIPSVPIKI
jgi:hypothetical protein